MMPSAFDLELIAVKGIGHTAIFTAFDAFDDDVGGVTGSAKLPQG
jgi:hypothetical protein